MEKSIKPIFFEKGVVNEDVTKAVKRLAPVLGHTFYLAGGTALALRIGHRMSIDLDLFSNTNRLETHERETLLSELEKTGHITVRESTDGTCHFLIEKTAVSLFRYRYPLLEPLTQKWQGLPIAHERDIAAMKLSAVLGRGTKKDFVDLYFLSQRLGLNKIFEAGEEKFHDHSNFVMQAAKALLYFEDAEKDPLPRMIKKVLWGDIKQFFKQTVPKLIKSQMR